MAKYVLRDYQQECVDIVNSLDKGRYIILLATGLGKTVMVPFFKRQGRLLFISHREELVTQPKKYFECSFGIEKGSRHSNGEEVVSASIQTLSNEKRMHRFAPDEFDIIIVDECHHYASSSKQWTRPLHYFKPRLLIGLTATLRGDGTRLDDIFDKIVFRRDIAWGIRNGWLCKLQSLRVITNADLSGVHYIAGDFSDSELAKALEDSDSIVQTAVAYKKYCHDDGRQTLLYTVSVDLCNKVQEAIQNLLPKKDRDKIQVITGHTTPTERRNILAAFHNHAVRCIINCNVLTEGYDEVGTTAILNMRATCCDSLFQQMVGRGLRIAKESSQKKENCLLIDVVPQTKIKERRLCTALTLFGIDPDLALPAQREKMERAFDVMEMADSIRHIVDDRMRNIGQLRQIVQSIDLFADEQTQAILREEPFAIPEELSRYHVSLNPSDDERYSVSFFGGRVTFSEPDLLRNTFMQVYIGDNIYNSTLKMSDAVALLDSIIRLRRDPRYLWDKRMHAMWVEEPATDKQIWRLKKMAEEHVISLPEGTKFTKASASDLISLGQTVSTMRKDYADRGLVPLPEIPEGKTLSKQESMDRAALEQEVVQAYDTYRVEMENRRKDGEANFEAFRQATNEKASKTPPIQELQIPKRPSLKNVNYEAVSMAWKMEPRKEITFTLELQDSIWNLGGLQMTSKQVELLQKLFAGCNDANLHFSDKVHLPQRDRTYASILIALLMKFLDWMRIINNMPDLRYMEADVESINKGLAGITRESPQMTVAMTAFMKKSKKKGTKEEKKDS